MRKFSLFFLSAFSFSVQAQSPEDALRLSWFPQNGSARNLSIGGCMGSLGGDITAAFVNPAGLAQFRNPEAVLSLGFSSYNTKSIFRDSATNEKRNAFPVGPWGIIFANSKKSGRKNDVISMAINQKVGFGNSREYAGLNNYSSYSEQFAEEFAASGYTIEAALNSNSPLPYSAAPALFTYLIDTATENGIRKIVAAPESILNSGQAISQHFRQEARGGWYDLAISYAGTKDDKLLWGGSLGIPLLYYRSTVTASEQDTSANTGNGFKSFTYTDRFSTEGAGFDLKAGVIYRPADYLRIGLALHSPTFFSMTEKRSCQLNTVLESDSGTLEYYSADSRTFTNGKEGETKYMQTTPFRAILSASYVFREEEDIKRQRGFLTADIEYVAHGGTRFHSDNEDPTEEEKAYYRQLNKVIKDQYRGAFNFRLGAEVKFSIIMARLGLAYYSNPYRDRSAFKADQMLCSGGLGYRDKGFFIDASYTYRAVRDAHFPYRLADLANTFATTRQTRGSIMVTAGFKL